MKLIRLYFYAAGVILLFTAAAKFYSAFGQVAILYSKDPLTGLVFKDLLRAVGGIEAVVAIICIFCRQRLLSAVLVALLSSCFLVYRIGLAWIGFHKPCSCLGNLTDALHVAPQTADSVMKIVLGYLFIGSYAVLFWLFRRHRRAAGARRNC